MGDIGKFQDRKYKTEREEEIQTGLGTVKDVLGRPSGGLIPSEVYYSLMLTPFDRVQIDTFLHQLPQGAQLA